MKVKQTHDQQWVGIDLHVHTPASTDYRGAKDEREYLEIIRGANEFTPKDPAKASPRKREQPRNSISCIAFTDHNSVEGIRNLLALREDTQRTRDSIRARDPGNSLLKQLEEELKILDSVRILMGVEIKANPGIHLLTVFHESVEANSVIAFLEEIYGRPYAETAGDPSPVTRCTLVETLDTIREQFGEKAFVVAPHIDGSGGLLEGLKEYGQLRMEAFKHPIVRALSFNKLETRQRVRELMKQPDYGRPDGVALVQSSDFHGSPGSGVGQPRTDVLVPSGKATFANLKQAFAHPAQVKCSIDFVEEEYERLIEGKFVVKYTSNPGEFCFRDEDHDAVAASVCAMTNSEGGILQLDGNLPQEADRDASATDLDHHLRAILDARVEPKQILFVHRHVRMSPGKVRALFWILPSQRLYASGGRVFAVRDGNVALATPQEIESIVSRKLAGRFGPRFERALEDVSTKSTLLSRLPRGIPLVVRCEDKLAFHLPKAVKVELIEPVGAKGPEIGELVRELYQKTRKVCPYGLADGNATIVWDEMPPRFEQHYMRFTAFRGEADGEALAKCSWGIVEKPSIIVVIGGGVALVEPSHLICDAPALLLKLEGDWETKAYSLATWLKFSFVLWYCAVHLGDPDIFIHLQTPTPHFPIARRKYEAFYSRLDAFARNIILDEKKFVKEDRRMRGRDELGPAEEEKALRRHNDAANRQCLAMDKEVFEFLGLTDREIRHIMRTFPDIHLSDFGYSAQISEGD